MTFRKIEIPENAPSWLTKDYVAYCKERDDVQASWEPRQGDWFWCDERGLAQEMDNPSVYARSHGLSEETIKLHVRPEDDPGYRYREGRWTCDTVLPDPSTVEGMDPKYTGGSIDQAVE